MLAQGVYSEVSRFGMAGGEAPPDFAASGEPGDFDVLHQGRPAGRVSWALPGAHNQLNALAAIAAAWHAGVPPQQACEALARFENVRRRMEVRARIPVSGGSITLYDDFAHHPTAIRATVDGLGWTWAPSAMPAAGRGLTWFPGRAELSGKTPGRCNQWP